MNPTAAAVGDKPTEDWNINPLVGGSQLSNADHGRGRTGQPPEDLGER